MLDLGDAVITPGLTDCHTHFFYWALSRALAIDVSGLSSLNATLDRIRKSARRRRVGDWVVALGFNHNLWGRGFPQASDLDTIDANVPIMVRSRDFHTVWLNSAGVRRAGLTRKTSDPPGGRYVRDESGRPTGIVLEAATTLLPDPLQELAARSDAPARRTIDRALRSAYEHAWSLGFVGIHSVDDGLSLGHLQRHREKGQLGLRVLHAIQVGDLPAARRLGLRSGLGDDWLSIGGVKMFADGALGGQTALMYSDYPGRPGYRGVAQIAGYELREHVRTAVEGGLAVWIHAIGDRAVADVLGALDAVRKLPPPLLPHRIEHVQCIRARDVLRLARLGIVASVQPAHLLGDIPIAEQHWPRASRNAYAYGRLRAAGVTLACGSDVPVDPIDARRSLYAGVLRMNEHGEPAGGWYPDQRVAVADVLDGFTVGAARCRGQAAPAGTLAVGAPADLTIWGTDPLRSDPADLLRIPVQGCVIDGEPHLAGE